VPENGALRAFTFSRGAGCSGDHPVVGHPQSVRLMFGAHHTRLSCVGSWLTCREGYIIFIDDGLGTHAIGRHEDGLFVAKSFLSDIAKVC
jgi:hypothetical protein